MSHNSHAPRLSRHEQHVIERVFSSTPRGRKGGCSKRRFSTEIDAKLEIARFRRIDDPKRGSIPCRAYLCPSCSGWHLTSKPLAQPRSVAPECGCGKASYVDRSSAEAALERIAANPRTPVIPTRSYQCSQGVWHLTSKPQLNQGEKTSCGRLGFKTELDALQMAVFIAEHPRPGYTSPKGVALCGSCGHWHFTH